VNAQKEELRTQLKESKTYEKALQEQINKAKDKYLDLYQAHEKLKMYSNSEEIESQLNIMQRKMVDVKSAFGCIDIIKIQCIEEVKTYKSMKGSSQLPFKKEEIIVNHFHALNRELHTLEVSNLLALYVCDYSYLCVYPCIWLCVCFDMI